MLLKQTQFEQKRVKKMAVDDKTVQEIAALAHLKIENNKLEETKTEFNKILAWIDQLDEVETNNIESLSSVYETALVYRPDEVTDGNQKDAILQNAPATEFGYFTVPKVVEQ